MADAELPDAKRASELARTLYDALASGDRDRLAELLHPDFKGRTSEGLPLDLGGVYVGPDRMRQDFWGRIAKNYRARAVPEEYQPLTDGRLMVLGRYKGSGRAGGAPLDAFFVHLLRFAGEQVVELAQYTDTARWTQALTGHSTGNSGNGGGSGSSGSSGTEGSGATAEQPAEKTGAQPAEQPAAPAAPAFVRRAELTVLGFEVTDGLAHLTLDRPDARNALDAAMADELLEVAHRLTELAGLRAVLLTGNGPAFTVGGDIAVFAGASDAERPGLISGMASVYHRALDLLSALEAPIVCAVQGAAAGGGLGLVHGADVVLAGEQAKFALGFAALGLTSDGGTSWYLPRLIGPRRAAQLYFEQRVLTAREAADLGLVTRVVADDTLQQEALAVARRLAAGPTRAYAGMRRLLLDSTSRTLSAQLAAEERALHRTAGTADAAEGIASFIGKREPNYQGR